MTKNKIIALIVLGGILILAIGAGLYFHFKNTEPESGTSEPVLGSVNYQFNTKKFENESAHTPDLERSVHFGVNVAETQQPDLRSKINIVRERLMLDKSRADDWFTLAVLYHGANDFDAARDVWEFLLKVIDAPQSAVLYDNLGKLYKFDLKDFPKSEKYFKESINANPTSLSPYTELFELYRYLYKTNTTAAADILTDAGKKFPSESDPYVLLGEYYRDQKKYADARSAFAEAITRAQSAGNVEVANSIRKEMDSLPK